MRRSMVFSILFALTFVTAACAQEENSGPVTVTEEEPGLLAQATVSPDSAVALARAQVREGEIEKAEIENEDGRLIYSFDFTSGEEDEEGEEILEVHIDALTGAVLSVEEESGGEGDEMAEERAEGEHEEGMEAEEEHEGVEGATGQVTEESPGLFEKAAFSADSALVLARVRFPDAEMLGGELEMEDGQFVFSFDLKIEGEEGITEVWVDAKTGEIVSVEHEGEGEG